MQNSTTVSAALAAVHSLKALVVNESLLERISLGKMCAFSGFQVHEATAEDNLIEYIEQEEIDLVVCDSRSGEHEGLEICSRIRAAKLEFFVYVLLLSSHQTELFAVRAMEAGADEHLCKPLDKAGFTARLSSIHQSILRQKGFYSTRAALPDSLQELYRDMRALSGYQRARLPRRKSVLQGLQIDYLWIPKVFVSGDLFDVFVLDDQYAAFYILDVVGHGVPSALHVMDLSNLLTANPTEGILLESLQGGFGHRVRRPAEVLGLMNSRFQMRAGNEVFFSMMYGLFNLHTGVVTVSMAGSPLPWVQHLDGSLTELGQNSFPIGVIEDDSYEDYECRLEAGMRLFICSDGLTQIRDAQDQELDVQGVAALIQDGVQKSLSAQIEEVQSGLAHWVSGKSTDRLYEDDSTLLALQWRNQGDDDLYEDLADEPALQDEDSRKMRQLVEAGSAESVTEEPVFKFLPRKEASRVLLWRMSHADTELPTQLLQWGYVCTEVLSGQQCLQAASESGFSFLLVDLPDFAILDSHFLESLRAGMNPGIFVLLLTNALNRASVQSALHAGADSCTSAEYSAREIYTRLNTGLRLANSHQLLVQETRFASELRQDIEKDLIRISSMQLDNLPKPMMPESKVQFQLFFQPAGLLSSHYMNVMPLPDGSIAFFHLSTEGKGLVGAARGLSLFRQLTAAALDRSSPLSLFMGDSFSPASILRELNARLLQASLSNDSCAICYGVLNPDTSSGRVAHAGYPLHVITKARGHVEKLGAYGSRLGVSIDSQYQDVVFTMNPGDRLIVFPDELNFLPGLNGSRYDSLDDFLLNSHSSSCIEFVQQITALSVTREPVTQDQSLLIFQMGEYKPLQQRDLDKPALHEWSLLLGNVLQEPLCLQRGVLVVVSCDVSMLAELIEDIEATLVNWGVDASEQNNFQLVLLELASNVCRHSGLSKEALFELLVFSIPGGVLFVMRDSGEEIPSALLQSAREHDYDFDESIESSIPTGGLGLPLVMSLTSRFEYRRYDDVNHFYTWFNS